MVFLPRSVMALRQCLMWPRSLSVARTERRCRRHKGLPGRHRYRFPLIRRHRTRNGVGKSTTMRVILGLDAADAGTALIGGRPYWSLRDPLSQVGSLLDAGALQPSRSARNHLLWLAHSQGLGAIRVEEVIAQAGLESAVRHYPMVAPGAAYYLITAGGILVSLGIIAATFPLLARITGPEVARNE